ncbi:amino acid ABC transporter permease [Paenibacillus brasilensis]|uniref:Cystine transport system permease protein n=1 Tax=Paenibacillus brasilensis TaxID=128574 RepID=A0ABU0L328_9BACL|nr:amino acid ABC transporter permease [Paenibacillus brasilensis]MDQ0495730.1 cystine transport system permease protein [Paenibacillus brasilensis]
MLELMWENVPFLLKGAYYTLYITIVSMLFGLIIGLVVAVARLKGNRPVRWLSRSYVSIIRGTPVLVQIAVIYYGLDDYGISFGSLTAVCLALSINTGAYLSETFRGAILAVPQGQTEALYATGMSPGQTMWRIILPQAVRIAIPPMGNTFVGMLKETSLVSVIGVSELMRQAQLLQAQYLRYMPFLLEIGLMYWIMSIGFSAILERVEKRLARAY